VPPARYRKPVLERRNVVSRLSKRLGWWAGLLLLAGCSGGRGQLLPDRAGIAALERLLLVGAGPALVSLDVGMAGKMALKGIEAIVERDPGSSLAQELHRLGLLPRRLALETAAELLAASGWQVTMAETVVEKPGRDFAKLRLPEGLCAQAQGQGADGVLLLYQRLTLDLGATRSLAVSELWAHLFACSDGRLLWRARDKRRLSLNRFILEAARQALVERKRTLADFLSALRGVVKESGRALLPGELEKAGDRHVGEGRGQARGEARGEREKQHGTVSG